MVDDLEDFAMPPLKAKSHPRGDMDEAQLTIDDESRESHHHPNDAGVVEFEVDPEEADAAADLAGDLGAQFLEGATFAEDRSERANHDSDASEAGVPFLLDEPLGLPVSLSSGRRRRKVG
jgi:hypothetical protein